MKRILFLLELIVAPAGAATLHYGADQITLSPSRPTSPALAVGMASGVQYGALYSDTAPNGSLHIGSYWLGQYCPGGKYTSDGRTPCTDCGIGYYCTGNRHRASCTYGALGCPGASHSADAALPAGAPVNQFMELADVNAFIPPTEIGQWRQISCCNQAEPEGILASWDRPETINDYRSACAHGILGPGTYLFVATYANCIWASSDTVGALDGVPMTVSNAMIAVFDHPVGYHSIHGVNIYQHFVDSNHAPLESWTITTTPNDWILNVDKTNITGLDTVAATDMLCVYELK